MQTEKWLRWCSLVLVLLILAPLPAFSQNCSLCYTQAAASGARFIAALRSGILVLVIPPMFMSVGIAVMAYRKRNQFHRTDVGEEVDQSWYPGNPNSDSKESGAARIAEHFDPGSSRAPGSDDLTRIG